MNKFDIVKQFLPGTIEPVKETGAAFAPSNIALCKYWGKRDKSLNLPVTSSLSISLGDLGTRTVISLNRKADSVLLNHASLNSESVFVKRLIAFLDMFRPSGQFFTIETENNIPTAAGLASSASGYAALVMAINDLLGGVLSKDQLSVLARMGSGSACRSIYQGFVLWNRGELDNGMDSFAKRLSFDWPGFCIGIVHVTESEKPVSSRDAMNRTVDTSVFYENWPKRVENDLDAILTALKVQDFDLLGKTSESNALAMHATMIDTWPPVLYWQPETVAVFHKVWQMRAQGIPVYITIDAGPNVKLLFQSSNLSDIQTIFNDITVIQPFG